MPRDRGARALVAGVGVEHDAVHTEHVERVREHEELRLGVHRGALRRRGEPRRADLDAVEAAAAARPALRIEERRGADDPTVDRRSSSDRREREPPAGGAVRRAPARRSRGTRRLAVGHGCPVVGAAVFGGRRGQRRPRARPRPARAERPVRRARPASKGAGLTKRIRAAASEISTNSICAWVSASRSTASCGAEPLAEPVDQRRHRVDREPGRGEVGAGGRPSASGGVITPRCTRASCQIPSAWLATTSSTGVATSRACTSRSASTSSGGRLALGVSACRAPAGPVPGRRRRGRCSPDGVQRLLTLVSSRVHNRWEVGFPYAVVPTGRRPLRVLPSPVRCRQSGLRAGATVDASYTSAVAFASAAEHQEVMPQSPQTKPASTIAFALVKSA